MQISKTFVVATVMVTAVLGQSSQPTRTGFITSTSTLDLSAIATPASSAPASSQLTCSNGSTVKTTTDCTYPTITYTYCYSAPPPLTCSADQYPGTGSNRCNIFSVCLPIPTTTTPASACNTDGFSPTTRTLYEGTLSGQSTATTIIDVQCTCLNGYYSYGEPSATVVGGTTSTAYPSYCLPQYHNGDGICPTFMTSSVNSFSYTESSSVVSQAVTQCFCPHTERPQFSGAGPIPTACV